MINLKRAYDAAEPTDGYRILVDRLWPRGIRKEALPLDAWEPTLAPSGALRKWFGHDPARWSEFARRYRDELRSDAAQALLADLAWRVTVGNVTLVFAARDVTHSNAEVLKEEIESALGTGAHPRGPG